MSEFQLSAASSSIETGTVLQLGVGNPKAVRQRGAVATTSTFEPASSSRYAA